MSSTMYQHLLLILQLPGEIRNVDTAGCLKDASEVYNYIVALNYPIFVIPVI